MASEEPTGEPTVAGACADSALTTAVTKVTGCNSAVVIERLCAAHRARQVRSLFSEQSPHAPAPIGLLNVDSARAHHIHAGPSATGETHLGRPVA